MESWTKNCNKEKQSLSNKSHQNLTSENLSNGSVSEALEAFQSNVERMLDQGAKYRKLEEGQSGQCEDKKEVVPRVCVGLVLIAVLLILMALVLTYLDWEINLDLPDNNSTISEQWTSRQNE